MVFTVFQYVPILEEESPGHKVEMSKKADDTDGGDTDGSDDDCDDDGEPMFHSFFYSSLVSFTSEGKLSYTSSSDHYKYQLNNIHTPPPKA